MTGCAVVGNTYFTTILFVAHAVWPNRSTASFVDSTGQADDDPTASPYHTYDMIPNFLEMDVHVAPVSFVVGL